MIQNVLKLAFRNLRKQPGYTAINLLGLSLGLAACLLIALWVRDELEFDRFHEHAARIYQTQGDVRFGGTANNPDVSVMGSGDVWLAAYTGTLNADGAEIRVGQAQ